jgi:hypothetical protein
LPFGQVIITIDPFNFKRFFLSLILILFTISKKNFVLFDVCCGGTNSIGWLPILIDNIYDPF